MQYETLSAGIFIAQVALVVAVTGVAATVAEHTRKVSGDVGAAKTRGWSFFIVGVVGLLILPVISMGWGNPFGLLGVSLGSIVPLLVGLYFLFVAARYSRGNVSYWRFLQNIRRNAHSSKGRTVQALIEAEGAQARNGVNGTGKQEEESTEGSRRARGSGRLDDVAEP